MKLLRDVNVNQEDLEQLRKKIYDYVNNHDDVDIEDVKKRITPISKTENSNNNDENNNNDIDNENDDNKVRDWMLKRFLIAGHRNVDEAFEKFLYFFRFRHEFNVAKLTIDNVLPKEIFELQAIQKSGIDKQDNQIFIIRLKYYKKIAQLEWLIKRALFYYFEQLDLDYEHRHINGVCIVIDCQEFGISNVDLDLLQFLVKQIPYSYYGLVRNVLVYELPFLLSYIVKIVESWLPTYTDKDGNKQKFFAVIGKKNIDEFIDNDQRPKYLNGKLVFPVTVPDNALPFTEFVKQFNGQIKDVNVIKISQHINQMTKEQITNG
ncbi:Motile sperm domain-containing protein 2 [Dermatophagoides pteronyssinus]|uniref:Motile sperm domain-containing protein 2 n=1 Tax=Dermatophagoides pteronyssinus TaxID=6956 RepID=A0ABQ8JEV8_DERPT|nr:Motile sperm domain-containing protein 2 [Dermatophagoides pteronyssinus]